jgi:hypothetical protein
MDSQGGDGGRRQLQILAATLAAIPFVSGLAGMIAGPATLPGDNSRFESSADSEYRFASTFWFATAPILWSAVPNIEKRRGRFRTVCGVRRPGAAVVLASLRQPTSAVRRCDRSGADRDASVGGLAGQGREPLVEA